MGVAIIPSKNKGGRPTKYNEDIIRLSEELHVFYMARTAYKSNRS